MSQPTQDQAIPVFLIILALLVVLSFLPLLFHSCHRIPDEEEVITIEAVVFALPPVSSEVNNEEVHVVVCKWSTHINGRLTIQIRTPIHHLSCYNHYKTLTLQHQVKDKECD